MPNGLKIELTKFSIPCFVLETSLFITLIRNTCCSGAHNITNVCSINVWFKSKFTVFLLMVILVWYILGQLGCLKQT